MVMSKSQWLPESTLENLQCGAADLGLFGRSPMIWAWICSSGSSCPPYNTTATVEEIHVVKAGAINVIAENPSQLSRSGWRLSMNV
jgi:hypothetical protein